MIVKKYLAVFFILFLVSTLIFMLYFLYGSARLGKTPSSISHLFNSVRNESKVGSCDIADNINYYYYAPVDKNWERNNKFGLYVYAEKADYFETAQKLVNSNGGDWGYVLIPYNVKDRDFDKWGRTFSQLQSKHLIPVIQLWDVDLNDYKSQTKEAAEFLNSFIWPVRYRYISAYNEPNDSKFWYGKVDPANYAKILDYTIKTFKQENEDFFMLNAAFNVSAPTDGNNLDSFEFMFKMNEEEPGVFEKLDGWASHSYPQPNFSGRPSDKGRLSIQAYDDELAYLKNVLGVRKELPVFITETGWAHADGETYNSSYLPLETISKYFKIAYEDVWLKDSRVRAVMPFTIWYDPPFDHFSWISKEGIPYMHFEAIKSIKKVKGEPPKLEAGSFDGSNCLQ